MELSGEHGPLCQMQIQREQLLNERKTMALMQSGIGGLTDEMRSKQEDDSVFLTPRSSPYSPECATGYDIAFQDLVDLGQHSTQLQPTSPYLPGSPCEESFVTYSSSPPYSPPYDNSPLSVDNCSSPGSVSGGNVHPYTDNMCSPTSIPCTSSNQFSQFMPAPMPTIQTTSCSSMPFSTCCEQETKNTSCIYTPAYLQPPQNWGDMMYPPNYMGPTPEVPVEASIIVQDNHTGGGSLDIKYYPPSPQPETAVPSAMYPQNDIFSGYPPMSLPYSVPPKMPSGERSPGCTRTPKKSPRTPKIRRPIQVDDSEIKDIPTSAQLWEFTLRVLKKPKYSNIVSWENQKEGLFRFHDAQAFAALWGKHRNRPNMTYDKVARALRYYYKRNIFQQVGGRLTYRFSDRLRKLYQSDE